jgi:hypothetical protein
VSRPRYLTKSRFKLAVECPTKLYYTGKPERWANTQADDAFLAALADGGFQVGELAKLMFPGGIEVTATGNAQALARTAELLRQDRVTLFEAAIAHGPFLVRVDILRKDGDAIDLIEVKAKSFSSRNPHAFRARRGGLNGGMLPYLQDVAFQRRVLELAFPGWRIRSHLMLADTELRCSVAGLNQRFKIRRRFGEPQERPGVQVAEGTDAGSIGAPLLTQTCVDGYVDEILSGPLKAPGFDGPFDEVIRGWAEFYQADRRIAPAIGAQCGRCEFRAPADSPLLSGFHTCWGEVLACDRATLDTGTVLDLWNFRRKQELIDLGVRRLSQVHEEDIGVTSAELDELGDLGEPGEPGGDGLTSRQRQWMQVSGQWPGGGAFYLDRELLRREMAGWSWPLHFIDFETARVAIPFFAGQRPYGNIAFQFSHHRMERDGSVAHVGEFLSLEPGVCPNLAFVRALQASLGSEGTVFMWSPHENTTLRDLLRELEDSEPPPPDRDALCAFLRELITVKENGQIVHQGRRAMVDLCVLARRAFFHPATRGSSSIKKVLPVVMAASPFLRERYSPPIYGAAGGIPSRNFTNWSWWRPGPDGQPANPYDLLPPVFNDLPAEVLAALEVDEDQELAEGGSATTAWARMQFEDSPALEREQLRQALLRYCELDTLAMVMVWQGWAAESSL